MKPNTCTVSLAGLLAAPLLLSALPTRDALRFTPAEGGSLTFRFGMESTMTLDDMVNSMNGEEMPMEMDMEVTTQLEVTFEDAFTKGGDGRPAQFTRSFETIKTAADTEVSVNVMGEGQDQSIHAAGTSALEGKAVVFALKDGEYEASWPEGKEGDAELLEGLNAANWIEKFLPTGEIAEGESWDIDPKSLVDLMAPGGNLHPTVEVEGADDAMMMGPDSEMFSDLSKLMGDTLKGSVTGKFSGYREVEGARLAVIALEVEIDSLTDIAEMIKEGMAENLPPEIEIEMDIARAEVTLAIEAKGELLWNAAGGHLASLTLEGELAVAMDMEMALDAMGQQMEIQNQMEMSGTIKNTASAN